MGFVRMVRRLCFITHGESILLVTIQLLSGGFIITGDEAEINRKTVELLREAVVI